METESLETQRLILKILRPDDFRYMFEHYPEERIRQLLGHETDKDFLKEKYKYENGYTSYNRSFVFFQMIDKATMKIIGGCGFHNWYADHRRAELGYALTNDSFKRKGLMTEALKAMIDYGFNKMNLHRMEALVGSENIPSLRLMEKFGFNREGVLAQHYFVDGKFEDSVVWGRVSEDL